MLDEKDAHEPRTDPGERGRARGAARRLTSTYRLQLNAGFNFASARAVVPYLARLGVSHIYCSPILTSRRGSMHGYDVVDPSRLDPELGTEDDLRALSAELQAHDMGMIVDIVPNHMGIGAENPFWDDVLMHGDRSKYAKWFDVAWHAGERKVTLPVLSDELDLVIEKGELALRSQGRAIRLVYYLQSFPLDPETLPPELQLAQLDRHVAAEITELFRGDEGQRRLRELLDAQHYRLVSWRHHADEINYRHFFDVTDLAGVRVEDPAVFEETHALILRLVADGVIDGVRVDHIDGLADPKQYLDTLRDRLDATGRSPLLFVEKVLAWDETLRASWPVEGTTGYEFLNVVEDALISPQGFDDIECAYRRTRRLHGGFADVARAGKLAVLRQALRPDVDRLVATVLPLAYERAPALDAATLAEGIIEFVASLPVYRTYLDDGCVHDADREAIERAVSDVRLRDTPAQDAVRFIADLLLGRARSSDASRARAFTRRLQQLSGPATAKGVEDTALYVYVPLASRNDVGGGPDRPLAHAVDELHKANALRADCWPVGLTCTMTHDSKRSGDVRARIDALAEMPHDWERTVRRWRRLNTKHRPTVRGRLAPDTNTEYLLYQTLVALWPPPRIGRRMDDLPDRAWRDALAARLDRYVLKAAREAKLRTSWVTPDLKYEEALARFTRDVLEPGDDAPFLLDLARLVSRVAPVAAWNTLSRIAMHLTSPGTPDVYQGDELPTFALVDPDNRQPVDYESRSSLLDTIEARGSGDRVDVRDPSDPRLKLAVTQRLLTARRRHPDLLARGAYRPLEVTGERAEHVIAFARICGRARALTVVPRLVCDLVHGNVPPDQWWGDTAVEVPDDVRGDTREWKHLIDGGSMAAEPSLELRSLFVAAPLPVVLLQ